MLAPPPPTPPTEHTDGPGRVLGRIRVWTAAGRERAPVDLKSPACYVVRGSWTEVLVYLFRVKQACVGCVAQTRVLV